MATYFIGCWCRINQNTSLRDRSTKIVFMGKTRDFTSAGRPIVHERTPIDNKLTSDDINNIVDNNVREAVLRMKEVIGDFKKWSVEKHGYPSLKTKDQHSVPIKRVRIRRTKETAAIGVNHAETSDGTRILDNSRHVDASEKHHVTLFVSRKETGKAKKLREKWVSEYVSVLEAHRRHSAGLPVICKQYRNDPDAGVPLFLAKRRYC